MLGGLLKGGLGGLFSGRTPKLPEPTAAEKAAALSHLAVDALRGAVAADLLEPGQAETASQCARLIAAERGAWEKRRGDPEADADWIEVWIDLCRLLRSVQLANRMSRMRLYTVDVDKLLMGVKRKTFQFENDDAMETYKPEFFEERLRGQPDADSAYVQGVSEHMATAFANASGDAADAVIRGWALAELHSILETPSPVEIDWQPRPAGADGAIGGGAEADGAADGDADAAGGAASTSAALMVALGALMEALPEELAQPGYPPARDLGEQMGRLATAAVRDGADGFDDKGWETVAAAIRNYLRMTVMVYEPDEQALLASEDVHVMRHRLGLLKRQRRAVYRVTGRLLEVADTETALAPDELLEKERRQEVLDNRAPPFPEVFERLMKTAMGAESDPRTAAIHRRAATELKALLKIERQQVFGG